MRQIEALAAKTTNRLYLYFCLASSLGILLAADALSLEAAKSVSSFYLVVFPISAVIISVVALNKHGLHTNDGRLILLFTIYATAKASAELLWVIQQNVLRVDPMLSEADVVWFASYGALFAFFTVYFRPIKKSIPRNIRILAVFLAGSFLIPSAIGVMSVQEGVNDSGRVMSFLYVVCDSAILYHAILGLIFLYNGRKNEFLSLLFLAIISMTVSDVFFIVLAPQYHGGSLINLGWVAGYLFLAFAMLNFKSLSKTDSFQNFFHVEGKHIVAPMRFETIVRFVIPFVVGVAALISIMLIINNQYANHVFRITDYIVIDTYAAIGLLVSLSFVVLYINHKLFHLVKSRTVELESERDMLRLQIKEKNETIQKSKILEEKLEKTIQTLASNEQKYRNLYDGSNDLYCTIDCTGLITDCNESFARNLRSTKDRIVGKVIFDYLAEKSVYDMNMAFATWINTGTTLDREIWLRRADDTSFPTLLSMSNLYDKDGALVGSNTTMKDITAQKAMSDQLTSVLTELQRTEKLKDEFLAMVSHELKTPLVPIIGYCNILSTERVGALNEEQKKRISILYSSGMRLKRLINDILDIQKITLGQINLQKQPIDIKEIIRDTIEDFLPIMEEKHITIKLDEKNQVTCVCDKQRIQQVLANLVRNSIDFCPPNKGKITIHVSSDKENAKIVFEDNGRGIHKEKLSKLFVKFYQIDTSSTREHGGTGLGLSICKGIIEEHGGKIWAESEGLGKGTQVHIMLPIDK